MIEKIPLPPLYERKSKIALPNGARMMIYFYASVELWDWDSSKAPPPMVAPPIGAPTKPDLATTSGIEYGFNVGIWRLMNIWKANQLLLTISVSGLAAERYPELVKTLAREGHEIAAHGYHQGSVFPVMDRERQQADIRRSLEILEKTTGQRPVGWVGPGARANETTIELLAEERLLYCCEYQDDELPYHLKIGNNHLVIVPFRFDGNPTDLRLFNPNASRDPAEAFRYLKRVFDFHYKAAASAPLVFYYGVHPFVSGRPERAEVLDIFIKYVKGFPDVWISTRRGIAEWYKQMVMTEGREVS